MWLKMSLPTLTRRLMKEGRQEQIDGNCRHRTDPVGPGGSRGCHSQAPQIFFFLLLSLQTAQGMAVFVQLGEGHWGLRRALEAAGRVGDITESWDY